MKSNRLVVVLILVVGVILVTLIPVLFLELRRTPEWQLSLTDYLEASSLSPEEIESVRVAEAQAADALPTGVLIAAPTGWTWESIEAIPPAERVRCIRLESERRETAGQAEGERLLMGYHDDGLYRAGWLVHEFPAEWGEEEREALFADVGCSQWEGVSLDRTRAFGD